MTSVNERENKGALSAEMSFMPVQPSLLHQLSVPVQQLKPPA
jgi:hypothetical protein